MFIWESMIDYQLVDLDCRKFGLNTVREKCPYLALFWSVFSRIWTE